MLSELTMKKKIVIVAGARPNFIKIAPLIQAFKTCKDSFDILLVHTGQHYDFQMSEVFFKDLDIPMPDLSLNVGSASHAVQTAQIMIAFEKVVLQEKPDLVMVVGDVNSTLACSLVAVKLNVKTAHVEAGLRSFDRTMPEEINRIVTDSISDYLFVSEESGIKNLKKEGIDSKKIYFVGNVMIDTLLSNLNKIDQSDILHRLRLTHDSKSVTSDTQHQNTDAYSVLTLHRPSNVDSKESLAEIYDIIESVLHHTKIIYPVHPRTKKMMESLGYLSRFEKLDNLTMIDPIGYIDFVKLVKESRFVLTDSGGIQEETTILKVPCLTMRENTERPVTITKGTNNLVGRNKVTLMNCVEDIMKSKFKRGEIPELWNGKSSTLIVNTILKTNS